MDSGQSKRINPAAWVPTLYTAEGLPFVIVATVTSLMYKSMGVQNAKITFWTGLMGIPWMIKPLWGPLLEMFKTKKFFVLLTQFVGGVSFGLLALSLHLPHFFAWSIAVFGLIAINFSVHDTAADGVYVNTLDAKEQAEYVGWQGAAYNVGKLLSQGAFVMLAGYLEKRMGVMKAWSIVMAAIGGLFVLMSLYHARFLPTGGKVAVKVESNGDAMRAFWDVIKTFFEKKYIWWGMAFLVVYRFAEGQAIKVVPLFLREARGKGGLGLSTSQIGTAYGILPPLAFVAGSIAAGYFTANRGLRKSLLVLCFAFNLPFFAYAYLALFQPTSMVLITFLMAIEYFGYGFGFIALTLFMMQQIAPGKYKTSHYAFATSLMQFGCLIPSMASGWLSDKLGYQKFFVWVMIATIPSFLITWFVPFRVTGEEGTDPKFSDSTEATV